MAVELWRERGHMGEVESEHGVTKSTRWRYLWLWGSTTELGVTSASAIEAWVRESYGGGCWKPKAEDGRGRRDGIGIYRPDSGRNKEGKQADLGEIGRFPSVVTAVRFHAGQCQRRPEKGKCWAVKNGKAKEEERKEEERH